MGRESSPSPTQFYAATVTAVLAECGTNRRLQPALIVIMQLNEPERLQAPGHGMQHLCSAKHKSSTDQKHQLRIRTKLQGQRFRKPEQPPGHGENLQFGRNATTASEAKHRNRRFRQM